LFEELTGLILLKIVGVHGVVSGSRASRRAY
jgi:hypothetical protein